MSSVVRANKVLLLVAAGKAAIAGAGLAIAGLAAVDVGLAVLAKETWDFWQIDQLVNKVALVGAGAGLLWELVRAVAFR